MLPAIDLEIIATKEIINQAQTKLGRLKSLQDDCTVLASFVERIKGNLDVLSEDAIASLKTSIVSLFDSNNTPPTDPSDNDPDGGGSTPYGDDSSEIEQPYDPMETACNEPAISTNLEEFDNSDQSPEQEVEFKRVTHTVGYFHRGNQIICCYAGFNNKSRGEAWGKWLVDFSLADGFELRPAKRLVNFKHEIKIWGLTEYQIERLSESDFTKNPGSTTAQRFPTAKKKERAAGSGSYGSHSPLYTKPTHRLYINGQEKLYADEVTVRRIYNEAIADPDTLHARILSAYKVESEYHQACTAEEAGLEPSVSWMKATAMKATAN